MPELPEVETVTRLIRPAVEGRLVRGVEVSWPRTVGSMEDSELEERVRGRRIARVWRRAKYIVFDLERNGRPSGNLVVHLRMTGRLHVVDSGEETDRYERVRLLLDRGRALVFVDVRKFGRFLAVDDCASVLGGLGPEPLGDEFTPAWFRAALRARRRVVKPLLLDQSFLAGLGNIYVDEALHRARLHPLRRSDRLRPADVTRLHGEIRRVLADAIEREGSSFDTFYRTPEGQPGSYQHQFQVYGRDGKPCRACGATLRKMVVGQRGTHVCLRCQRPPRKASLRI
jgi:formamidopyrimidine-DNA glycosylase